MKKLLPIIACILGATISASAAAPSMIYITNKSSKAVWVTTYSNASGRHSIIKATCYRGGSSGAMNYAMNDSGSWTLFEYKQDKYNCNAGNSRVVEKNVKTSATITDNGVAANQPLPTRTKQMKKPLLTALFILGATASANAAPGTVYIDNKSSHAVWVTTYLDSSARNRIIKAKCIGAGGSTSVDSNDKGSWTLFEYKNDKMDCHGGNIRTIEKQ